MEQEVGISVQGEARAIWEVGGAVGMVSDAAPGARLFIRIRPPCGVLYTHGLHEWMVVFEDNATGVPVSPTTPHKLFQDRATAGSWSCVLAATPVRLSLELHGNTSRAGISRV